MKIKIPIWNKIILKKFFWFLTVVSTISTIIFVVIEINKDTKHIMGFWGLVIFIIVYLSLWLYENLRKNIKLYINGSRVNIKVGDIFTEAGLKAIGVNEYFDNIVDDKIIAKSSLHGKYIMNNYKDTTDLDYRIDSDLHLSELKTEENQRRAKGKKQKYKLGSIFVDGEYLLTAFAKFDDCNRAYLYMSDYINFLLNFWNEIDVIYAGKPVTIPLFGTGITRFKGYELITEQELLEMLIWSFKVSRIKFQYPSYVTIIIHESIVDKINFSELKEWE